MEDNLIETWSGETSFKPNGTGRGEISRSDSEPQFFNFAHQREAASWT